MILHNRRIEMALKMKASAIALHHAITQNL